MKDIKLSRIMDGLRVNKDPYYRFWCGLVQAFKKSGMSQGELAKRTGISQPHVSRILQGLTLPNAEKISHICGALAMSREAIEAHAGPEVEAQMAAGMLAPYLAASSTKISSGLEPTPTDPRGRFMYLPYIRVWNLFPEDRDTGWEFGPDSPIAFDRSWLYLFNISEKLGVYRAEDDDMAPALSPGDMAIIDTAVTEFSSPGVYFAIASEMPFFCRYAKKDIIRGLPERLYVDNEKSSAFKDELPTGEIVPYLELDPEHLFKIVGKVALAVRTLI